MLKLKMHTISYNAYNQNWTTGDFAALEEISKPRMAQRLVVRNGHLPERAVVSRAEKESRTLALVRLSDSTELVEVSRQSRSTELTPRSATNGSCSAFANGEGGARLAVYMAKNANNVLVLITIAKRQFSPTASL
jgi:hypothetical protein